MLKSISNFKIIQQRVSDGAFIKNSFIAASSQLELTCDYAAFRPQRANPLLSLSQRRQQSKQRECEKAAHVRYLSARSLIMIIFERKHPLGASNKTLYAFIYKLRSQPSAPESVRAARIYIFPAAKEARERKAEREMLWPEKHPWENSFRGLFTQHKESPANHQQ